MDEDIKKVFLKAYDDHADALFRHCLFKINDREKSIDITQEAFMKTWVYISLGKKISNMRAFLYKTLNNLIVDEYRKKKNLSLDLLSEDGFDPHFEEASTIEEKLDGAIALSLLRKLPDQYKDILFMKYVSSLDIREISEIVGESENTVTVRIHRGIKKLKELFKL